MTTAQIAWWALVIWFAYVGLSSVLDVNKPQKLITNLRALRGVLTGLIEIAALLLVGAPAGGWAWIWWFLMGMIVIGTLVIVSQIGKTLKVTTPRGAAFSLAMEGLLILGLYAIRPF
jgi:hypothetical protein